MAKFTPVPKEKDKGTKRQKINNNNRVFGKTAEREVSKLTGGYRTAMSGAAKWTNQLGDIHVPIEEGSPHLAAMIEVKTSANINTKGDKVFNLKKSVLTQAMSEADTLKTLPVVWLHFKGDSYTDDFAIIPAESFLKLLDLAKQAGLIIKEEEN